MVCFWVVMCNAPAIVRHHSSVPSSFISSFHFLDVLVEVFTLFVANVATVSRKPVEMVTQEVHFELLLAPRRWYASSMFCTTSSKLAVLLLSRKFYTTPAKPHHASLSSGFIDSMKSSSGISFRMSGLSKIPDLSFSVFSPGNDRQMYLKHSPSLSRAFTNCLISPNFICREGVLSCLWMQGVHLLCLCLPFWVLFEAPNHF